jgi:hypothetical protein
VTWCPRKTRFVLNKRQEQKKTNTHATTLKITRKELKITRKEQRQAEIKRKKKRSYKVLERHHLTSSLKTYRYWEGQWAL